MKFNRVRHLPTGKGREIAKISRPSFLTSTASVSTEAILILSICRRFARLDIFAARFASINSICFRYAQTRYDINPRSRSEHIECLRSKHHIERVSVYRKSALADLYRCVPALWQVRRRRDFFFIFQSRFYTKNAKKQRKNIKKRDARPKLSYCTNLSAPFCAFCELTKVRFLYIICVRPNVFLGNLFYIGGYL